MHVPLLLAGFTLTGSAVAALPRGTACYSVPMHPQARPCMLLVMAPASSCTYISEHVMPAFPCLSKSRCNSDRSRSLAMTTCRLECLHTEMTGPLTRDEVRTGNAS